MDRTQDGIENYQERVVEIADTTYESFSAPAREYLEVIFSAPVDLQVAVFATVITQHDAWKRSKHVTGEEARLADDVWDRLVKAVQTDVTKWARLAQRLNRPVLETAELLWERLQTKEGDERIVALARLLRAPIIPYAQRPDELLVLQPEDVYDDARNKPDVLKAVAVLQRLMTEELQVKEFAHVLEHLLAQLQTPEERVVVLDYALVSTTAMRAPAIGGGLSALSANPLGMFLLGLGRHLEEEEEEPQP